MLQSKIRLSSLEAATNRGEQTVATIHDQPKAVEKS